MTPERERVARAIMPQISEGIGAILRKFCDSKEASIAREKLHALSDHDWECLIDMLSEASADAAIAAMDTRAAALREAAALGRALLESGATPRKVWRMLDEGISAEESERLQQRYQDALARRRST